MTATKQTAGEAKHEELVARLQESLKSNNILARNADRFKIRRLPANLPSSYVHFLNSLRDANGTTLKAITMEMTELYLLVHPEYQEYATEAVKMAKSEMQQSEEEEIAALENQLKEKKAKLANKKQRK